jgi:hypothetical protein
MHGSNTIDKDSRFRHRVISLVKSNTLMYLMLEEISYIFNL